MTSDHSKLQIIRHIRVFQMNSSHGESGRGPQSNSTLAFRQLLYTPAALSAVKLHETEERHTGNRMGWSDPHIHFSRSVFMHLCELCDNMKYGELLDSATLQGSSSFVFSFVSPSP